MTWAPPSTAADFYRLDEDNFVDVGWQYATSALKGLRPVFEAQVTSPDPNFNDWNSQLQGLTFSERGVGPTWRFIAANPGLFYLQRNAGSANTPDWQNVMTVVPDGLQDSSLNPQVKVSSTDHAEDQFVTSSIKFNHATFYLDRASNGHPIVSLSSSAQGVTDHGALTGLGDDDHTQYLLASDAGSRATFAADWTDLTDAGATTLHKHDHGGLDGLADDDHPQYVLASGARAINGTLQGDLIVQKTVKAEAFYIAAGGELYQDASGNVQLNSPSNLILNDSTNNVIAGDPGSESSSINVNGASFGSQFKISQIGGSAESSLHLHKHSTTIPPALITSRADSDTSAHADVVNNDTLFSIYATGRVGSTYEVSSRIDFNVDGTPSAGILPGEIIFRTNDGTDTGLNPPVAMTIRSSGHVRMEDSLKVVEAVTARSFYVASRGEVAVIKRQQFASSTEWIFQHNLNTLLPQWSTYDTKYRSIFPYTMTADTVNQSSFYFSVATAGFAVLVG